MMIKTAKDLKKKFFSKTERKSFWRPEKQEPHKEKWIFLYGLHTVQEALKNPKRKIRRMIVTHNGLHKLELDKMRSDYSVTLAEPHELIKIIGKDATHQGVLIETLPLESSSLDICEGLSCVLILDQITDPRNVGAIIRSAVAFGVEAIVYTQRYRPHESSVLAKAASGGLEHIHQIAVTNLARALKKLHAYGFHSIGLDSEGEVALENAFTGKHIALILGAEGKGIRHLTRKTATMTARISNTEEIHSLNVSNAAAIALYLTREYLNKKS